MAGNNSLVMRSNTISIHGGGIAGLWLLARLRAAGYDAMLFESSALGSGQSIAAQGILHSGLKYALGGKISKAARAISAMPDRWRAALAGNGEIDLSGGPGLIAATSQLMLAPEGMGGTMAGIGAQLALSGIAPLPEEEWPDGLKTGRFQGSVLSMNELVLNVPALLEHLRVMHADRIRFAPDLDGDARLKIFTAAGGNIEAASRNRHADKISARKRPLLMAMLRPAPFPLFAHILGMGEKPAATITTHTAKDGAPVWYIGGQVAERAEGSDRLNLFRDTAALLNRTFPGIGLRNAQWAALPVSRVEGVPPRGLRDMLKPAFWMPDGPVLRCAGDTLYGWPTKLTFAPLLADKVMEEIRRRKIQPAPAISVNTAAGAAPPVASAPWEDASWTTL